MRKGTIFRYELKRLLFSKEYMLLLVAALAYSVSLLRSLVLFGTNYTAPFSLWTFSTYCATLTPLLFILLLVLCARQFKASERGAQAIISATPIPTPVFRLLRFVSILCAYLIPLILSVSICLAYYWIVFDFTSFGSIIWLSTVLLMPSSALVFGTAMFLGEKKSLFVYILLAIILVVGVFHIGLPSWLDIIGDSVTLPLFEGAKDFSFSVSFLFGRAAFLIVGIILASASLKLDGGRLNKD